MKRLYLIRHAEPELGGKSHVCLGGRSDVPLSTEGLARAAAAAKCFPDTLDVKIYSSPMLRARQTAAEISAGRWNVELLPGMEEIDCGEWDGLSFEEIRAVYPELYAQRGGDLLLTPPGGESLESAAKRGMTALESLKGESAENIIVVAHKGINRMLLSLMMGREVADYRSLGQDYVAINCLRLEQGRFIVEAVNLDAAEFETEKYLSGGCKALFKEVK